jgi:hypothetical protein
MMITLPNPVGDSSKNRGEFNLNTELPTPDLERERTVHVVAAPTSGVVLFTRWHPILKPTIVKQMSRFDEIINISYKKEQPIARLYTTLERFSSKNQTKIRDGPDFTFNTLEDAMAYNFLKSGESELEKLEMAYEEAVEVTKRQRGDMQLIQSEYISVLNTACHYMLLLLNDANTDEKVKERLLATLPDLRRIMKRSMLHVVIPDALVESEQTTLAKKTMQKMVDAFTEPEPGSSKFVIGDLVVDDHG